MSKEDLHARVDNDLSLHPPKTDTVATILDELRSLYLDLAHDVIDRCPEGRDLSLALTDLEYSLRSAIGAVVKNQEAAER